MSGARDQSNDQDNSNISGPSNVQRVVHVEWDPKEGVFKVRNSHLPGINKKWRGFPGYE